MRIEEGHVKAEKRGEEFTPKQTMGYNLIINLVQMKG